MKNINIAIDGYSSCGKGTLARYLASKLHYRFVDTGAMYRAVTLFALDNGLSLDGPDLIAKLPNITIGFEYIPEKEIYEITLNGKNVEQDIRQMHVASAVSPVARIPEVRRFLVSQQKQIASDKSVVMDGRDIGTVVLPNAELKIFMTARPEVRAQRRFAELTKAGVKTTYEDVLRNITERDRIDSTREDSPLTLTEAYRVLDNSDLSIEAQNEIAMQWVRETLS